MWQVAAWLVLKVRQYNGGWLIAAAAFSCFACACNKATPFDNGTETETGTTIGFPHLGEFRQYNILAGKNTSEQSKFTSITTTGFRFVARFDSSAIYNTRDTGNQSDINKLYGFSEGIDNQQNSARIGWCWLNGGLRIFAYVYAEGIRYFKEIEVVQIGRDIQCSIKPFGRQYIFTVNDIRVFMPRGPESSAATGLLQFPYFGGDEQAPHDISIFIKNL